MIRIYSAADGAMHYQVPSQLVAVAKALFPADDEVTAIFSLGRRLVAHDLHVCEKIAINFSHDEAVHFARSRLVERRLPAQSAG